MKRPASLKGETPQVSFIVWVLEAKRVSMIVGKENKNDENDTQKLDCPMVKQETQEENQELAKQKKSNFYSYLFRSKPLNSEPSKAKKPYCLEIKEKSKRGSKSLKRKK